MRWTLDEFAHKAENFTEAFLCCNVNDFGEFVDCHGYHPSDDLLIQLAERLKDTGKIVYRFGGNTFVVRGQDCLIPDLNDGLGASVRRSRPFGLP